MLLLLTSVEGPATGCSVSPFPNTASPPYQASIITKEAKRAELTSFSRPSRLLLLHFPLPPLPSSSPPPLKLLLPHLVPRPDNSYTQVPIEFLNRVQEGPSIFRDENGSRRFGVFTVGIWDTVWEGDYVKVSG